MKTLQHCLLSAMIAAAGWAAQVGAPTLGYAPAGGQILPLQGIPAAASAGTAIPFSDTFLKIVISPRQDFALASSASSGAVLVAFPTGSTAAVPGASAYPDGVALSPNGTAAVLWFASERTLEIISGLPSASAVRSFNATFLSGASGDAPSSLAVADDGAWAAGAWSSGVWVFGPNGETRNLMAPDRAYALAFFAGREDLALATGSGIYSATGVGGSATIASLYSAETRLTPAGIGVSSDNQTVVMADARGSIITAQVSSGASTQTDCGCAPSGVFGMGGSLFRITGLTGSVFRLFDARAGSVYLAPLANSAAGGSR